MNDLKVAETVQQYAGTKKIHTFDFTNSVATTDTGLTNVTATAKPSSGTGITLGTASSGLIVQVTVDAEAITSAMQNQELLVEVFARGTTSNLSDILKKRIQFIGKIQ